MIDVLLQNEPYRYIRREELLENGQPDYRIQKFNEVTRLYRDMYYLDSSIQLDYCIEDPEYVKWLDPDPEVAAYPNQGDSVSYQPAI